MTATDEIVSLLSAQPMVALGLVTLTPPQYELLMAKVRTTLLLRAKFDSEAASKRTG
jgi:hypothetical protein